MLGELFALLSAVAFAIGTVSIAKASTDRRGDNGAFLSIVLTAVFSGILWLATGFAPLSGVPLTIMAAGVGFFVLGGVLSIVIARSLMFKSTVLAGAINNSLFRRLIPVFAAFFAFVLLGETITLVAAVGIAIIVAGLVMVFGEKPTLNQRGPAVRIAPADLRLGRVYGVVSSASYGAAYATRKLGMNYLPDPAFGAFIGAMTGIVWYVFGAIFSPRCRSALAGLFRDTGRWQFIAAASISVGQTSQFFALQHTEVVIVAIIGSLEVFFSMYLAAYVLRTEGRPSARVVLASIVAMAGVVLVAVS